MKTLLQLPQLLLAFSVLLIAALCGFIWENACAGFYYGQLKAQKNAVNNK